MKKEWKKKLKRMGAVLLLAALLVQTVGSHAYAADAGKAIKEEANVTESPDEAGEEKAQESETFPDRMEVEKDEDEESREKPGLKVPEKGEDIKEPG